MSNRPQSNRQWNDYVCLGALLTVSLLVGIAISSILPYYRIGEYAGPAMDLVHTGHIHDNFLPIGYPALLALGYKAFGSETGITAVNILLSLLMLASAWFYLRLTGLSVKLTLLVVSALSIYPDFSLSYNKTQDTNITAIAIFCFMSVMILMNRVKNRFGYPDVLAGITVGVATVIRPNMILLSIASWLFLHRLKIRNWLSRASVQAAIAAVVYCAITVLIHGSVFFPRNGPYNLYAGYNPYTSEHLWNEEDSIFSALAAQHLPSTDVRDPNLDSFYRASAITFVRNNPGQAARLDLLKFTHMMLPDLHAHPANTLAGVMKIGCSLAIPLWVAFSFLGGAPRRYDTRVLVTLVLVAIILPFCLVISTQRFRTPLDFICWTDLGATAAIMLASEGTGEAMNSSITDCTTAGNS